jgi:hypothetical protein
VPVAEIAGERTGQHPIDRARAATQRFLRRADQDQGQALLNRLEVDAQVESAAEGLSNDRRLRSTVEQKAPRVDRSIPTEGKTDLTAQLAGDIGCMRSVAFGPRRTVATTARRHVSPCGAGSASERARPKAVASPARIPAPPTRAMARLREDESAKFRDKASNCRGSIATSC